MLAISIEIAAMLVGRKVRIVSLEQNIHRVEASEELCLRAQSKVEVYYWAECFSYRNAFYV